MDLTYSPAQTSDGDELVVTGQKVWTSLSAFAQWIFALVRTDPAQRRHRGLTFVMIAMDSPRVEVRPIRQLHGEPGFSEVFLTGVRVPLADVVGEVGHGWAVAMATLTEMEARIFETALHILGPFAELTPEASLNLAAPGLHRRYWHARAARIFAGTGEVPRNIISERVLGLPREPRWISTRPRTSARSPRGALLPVRAVPPSRVRAAAQLLAADDPLAIAAAAVAAVAASNAGRAANEHPCSAMISGAGGRSCPGAHTGALAGAGADPADDATYTGLSVIYESFTRVGRVRAFTIAAVRGAAVGAGMNLALATDMRVVAGNARLMSGFLRIGLHPGGGHFVLLSRLAGREATAAMTLGGAEIDGDRAVALGLAWESVDDGAVEARAMEFAAGVAEDPTLARAAVSSFRMETGPPAVAWDTAVQTERAPQMWSIRRRSGGR